ncbi:MAG: DUF3341 domain-containing protein [Gemmatimonadaceae bacterium]|nr:DUF3341 domain-containing protein [Gemmatimonadaceae bacterium]
MAFGIVANFRELDTTIDAIKALKSSSVGKFTVYSPTIHHELEDAIDAPISKVRRFTLVGGLLGVSFGYWVAVWTSEYWPLVVGGKTIASWIPYTIIGFEMMVMVGALSTVFGMFILNGIPRIVVDPAYRAPFSNGDYGIHVDCAPDKESAAMELLKKAGATEVQRAR